MKNIKCKQILVAAVCLAFSLVLVNCGSTATDGKEKSVDVAALAARIVKEGSFKDEMNLLEDEQFTAEFEGVEEALIENKSVYMGTGATAEQVVVLEAKDASSAKKLKEQLMEKITGDRKENEGYNPEEVAKLKSPVLEVEGKYAILAVSKDNAKVEEIVKQECE